MTSIHHHYFENQTQTSLSHIHLVQVFTFPVIGGIGDGHTHRIKGVTSIDNEHYHRFNFVTGPPIELAGGGHYHLVQGGTFLNVFLPYQHSLTGDIYERNDHVHVISGVTTENLPG
ncbi:YmaF family protein [Bacillus carboniphilus]|uniref:YmaF family protein n=1 Tax=Bacillus carboniphilus TaxID=86663 RepID=A0ABY9JY75_9BACI|nr:YmaF family protein [Bacillus carboniphilus]WLR43468.1 YmaF family protein [Bacillus carboniphilus]